MLEPEENAIRAIETKSQARGHELMSAFGDGEKSLRQPASSE